MKKIAFLLAALLLFSLCTVGCKAADPANPAASAADIPEPEVDASASETELPAEEEAAPVEEAHEEPSAEEPAEDARFPSEYDDILRQYHDAALDLSFDPANYPMVLPEAIELLQKRWAAYPDDESYLYAAYADLDRDGLEELVVFFNGYEEEHSRAICGIYAIRRGSVEMMLGGRDGLMLRDEIDFLQDGTLLWWKGGRDHTPGTVARCSFAPDGYALDYEEWTWSYDVYSWPSYTNKTTGETLDGEGFFGAYTMADPSFRYDEVMTEWGYGMPVPFVENPGTSTEALLVTSAEYETVSRDACSLPQIALEGGDFDRFNEEMRLLGESIRSATWSGGYMINFDWARNGDILSIWKHEYYGGGYDFRTVYNFSISEAKQLSDDELLQKLGVNRADYDEQALLSLHGASVSLDSLHAGMSGALAGFTQITEHARNYFDSAQPTVDRNGDLVIFGEVASVAGGSSYMKMIPVYAIGALS